MTDYIPVDCGLHSEYELAILQRRRLELRWCDADNTVHAGRVTPLDLVTRDGAEFLQIRDEHGHEHRIRLDRITACRVAG